MHTIFHKIAVVVFLAGFGAGVFSGKALAAPPATIDSDVYAYITSPSSVTYFCAAGRLRLHLAPHSTTRYVGSFSDYQGLHAFPAFANATDPNAPVVAFFSFNGLFAFKGDPSFGSGFYTANSVLVPPGFRKYITASNKVYFTASAHAAHTATYNFKLTERVGHLAMPDFEYTGTMTIQYDANNRVSGGTTTNTDSAGHVHFGKLAFSGYYSTSYLYFDASINNTAFGIVGTFSGASWSGNAVSGTGANTRLWVISGTP